MTATYADFLASKRAVVTPAGIEVPLSAINDKLFPFQKTLVQWALRKGRAALFADTGLGKALPTDTPVLTPRGYRAMGELQVGDEVIGSNGHPTKVLGVYPQRVRPAYAVHFSDGTTTRCDIEHLWPVQTKVQKYRKQGYKALTLKEIIETGLKSQEGWRFFIPMVQPIEFEEAPLPLDPYTLGVLLGDGCISQGQPHISSPDEQVLERVDTALPNGVQVVKHKAQYEWCIRNVKRNGHVLNPVSQALRDLGLMGSKAEHKFIPDIYKFASRQSREALLQGLLDTDGHARPADNNIEYCTSSQQLAEDVAFLVQSLGGRAAIRSRIPTYTYDGEKRTGIVNYRMSVALPNDVQPFYLDRKADAYHPRPKYQPTRAIVSVEPDGEAEMICIAVEAPDHCYVIEHCIVTHNTMMQAEWARLTGQRTLIIAPLSVARQTVSEAAKISVQVHYTRSGNDLIDGINITNYEMISHFNPDDFGAVVLDESSILKSIDGETKTLLTEMFSATPYRLACTATPAPNDQVEIANHAEFLGIMSRTEMLATFFVHDSANGSGTGWRLKGHAHDAFYKWMASWSMSIKRPSDLGFSDDGYVLPALYVEPVIAGTDYAPADQLFFTGLKGITDRSRARKGTIEERVQCAVDLVSHDANQWILWCGMNDESTALARAIPDSIEITGSDSPDEKIAAIESFQRGEKRVMVTKSKIAGFGINLQNCHNMAFVGIGDSFESYYQCIRRCYRFGQCHPVHAYVIISEIEQEIYANVRRKEEEATAMSNQLIARVKSFERAEIEQSQDREEYATSTIKNAHYTLMQGDSCERMAEIASNSVGLTVTSIPFQDLYCYSPTERDLGNSKNASEFYAHLNYIIAETLRVTQPGRDCCVHVQQVAASLVKDGFIGLKDFRGEVVRAFCEQGWIYHGEITVDKNPQAQAVRTKAKGLLFVQLRKDSSWMRPGLADYVLIFRKPGENTTPVHPDLTNDEWIKFAHPVWYDIRESDTLNAAEARESDDEKHVCPLQLSLIERCIRLWSNPGELILDPFAGVGSTGYEAIRHRRRFVGCELKPSYFQAARKNLDRVIRSQAQVTLWSETEEEVEVIA